MSDTTRFELKERVGVERYLLVRNDGSPSSPSPPRFLRRELTEVIGLVSFLVSPWPGWSSMASSPRAKRRASARSRDVGRAVVCIEQRAAHAFVSDTMRVGRTP